MSDTHLIQSLEQLTSLYGAAQRSSTRKVHDKLTQTMQLWLRHCPFFILSSQGPNGIDCSPRGDACGEAFRILNQTCIALPDRRGNNRIDTLKNIINNNKVGLLFLIPGIEETLRVKGHASISTEPELLQQCSLQGELPATAIVIHIVSAYVQNARAIKESGLWLAGDRSDLPIPSAKDLYL